MLQDCYSTAKRYANIRIRRYDRPINGGLAADRTAQRTVQPPAQQQGGPTMIAHVAEFEGPADVLEGVGMQGFRERVIPVLEAQPGFDGYLILLNREKGKLLGVTLWDTEENGRLAGARLEQERRTGDEQMGTNSPVPELYDVIAKL